jgi:hypothetical protein
VLHARLDHPARIAAVRRSSIFSLQRDDVTVTTFSANLVLGNHAPAEDTGMALFIWVALLVISLASIAAFLRAIHMIDLPTM